MPTISQMRAVGRCNRRTSGKPSARPRSVGEMRLLSAEERALYERIPERVDYVPNRLFGRADAEKRFFGPGSEVPVPEWINLPEVGEEAPPRRHRRRVLSPQDEVRLFLRYNYARCRLSKLAAAQRRRRGPRRACRMVCWFRRVLEARADLVRANMALVLAMAKRTRIHCLQFGELISEGNMALLRSVEKFDVSRGYKFSTYACRAILRGFNRLATKTGRYRLRFGTEYEPQRERSDYTDRRHQGQREDFIDAVGDILARNRARLTAIERDVLSERFAIRTRGPKLTLSEVGRKVGLSNERVRQIQNVALGKVRFTLDEYFLTC